MKRYLEILGLKEGASKSEIKKAYRKMAMRYHPDVNNSADAKQKFLEILEAYEYLTGIRRVRKRAKPNMSAEDWQQQQDKIRKEAEEKARAKYRERVKKLRKEQERKQAAEFQKAIFILVGILILTVAIWQGNKLFSRLMINGDPAITTAKVIGIEMKRMVYQFEVGETTIEDRIYVEGHGITMLTKNDLPIKIGDEFELTYSTSNPKYHQLNFNKVSAETMRRYLLLTATELLNIYSEEWKGVDLLEQKRRASCMSLYIFNEYSYEGLSSVINHNVNPLENFTSNRFSWYFLSNDKAFRKIVESCENSERN